MQHLKSEVKPIVASLKSFLKNASVTFEFMIVVTIAFGYFIASSFFRYFSLATRTITVTDSTLVRIILSELALGVLVLAYLKMRGWKWPDFNFKITWKSSLGGLLLLVASFGVFISTAGFASLFLNPHILQTVKLQAQVGVVASVALSFVNALYEEVFVAAYVINTLERSRGALFAVLASALIRMSYHVYQGPPALIQILPFGLLYGFVYWRWKKLWPMVLAHALVDIIALNLRP